MVKFGTLKVYLVIVKEIIHGMEIIVKKELFVQEAEFGMPLILNVSASKDITGMDSVV